MVRFRSLVAAALLVLVTPVAAARAQGSAESQVRTAMNGFMSALNALDATAMATYFADDITAFVPTAQTDRAEGKGAVSRIFSTFVERTKPTTAKLSLVPEAMTVEASGNLGLVTFQIREPATVRRRTFVWRKVKGNWLIAHFHASDVALVKPQHMEPAQLESRPCPDSGSEQSSCVTRKF